MKIENKKEYLSLLTVADASASTGLSREQIRYYIKKGYLLAECHNGRYYIDRNDLAEFYYYDVRGGLNLLSYAPEVFEEVSYYKMIMREQNAKR